MKNANRILPNHRASAAARQDERFRITYKRIPLGESGVRLTFYIVETGKKWLFLDFTTEFMAIIDRAAKRARMNAGQFIFHVVEVQLPMLEAELQGQGRAAV
jgi:hypothetical protein